MYWGPGYHCPLISLSLAGGGDLISSMCHGATQGLYSTGYDTENQTTQKRSTVCYSKRESIAGHFGINLK